MSTNMRYKVYGERAIQIIAGSFGVSGGAIVNVRGEGFTVAYDATGKYTVTFDKTFPEAISAQVSLMSDTTAGVDQMVQIYSKVAGSMQIRYWDISGAALADPGTGANDRIHFVAFVKSSGV